MPLGKALVAVGDELLAVGFGGDGGMAVGLGLLSLLAIAFKVLAVLLVGGLPFFAPFFSVLDEVLPIGFGVNILGLGCGVWGLGHGWRLWGFGGFGGDRFGF